MASDQGADGEQWAWDEFAAQQSRADADPAATQRRRTRADGRPVTPEHASHDHDADHARHDHGAYHGADHARTGPVRTDRAVHANAPGEGDLAIDMEHGHGHSHDGPSLRSLPQGLRRVLLTVAGVVTLLTFIGAIALWPGERPDRAGAIPLELFSGDVLRTDRVPCTGVAAAVNATDCAEAVVRVLDGPDAGTEVRIEASVSGGTPRMRAGDTIQMNQFSDLSGDDPIYEFWQFERSRPLWFLAILFVFVVLAIGRLRGLRALCALMISLLIIVYFLIPSILTDHDPVLTALVAGSLITLCTLTISYGFTATAMTAFVGIVVSLLITGVLAQLFVSASRLSGLGDDQAIYLQAVTGGIDLRGLLLAGMVIGALGVLDDVTVTQASAVWEIHQANPALGAASLTSRAMRIGRNHIASTVNTLILAYVGTSLPLMLFFTETGQSLSTTLTGEAVATEIVRTLAGSIGLMCALPITTALTALVVTSAAERRVGRVVSQPG